MTTDFFLKKKKAILIEGHIKCTNIKCLENIFFLSKFLSHTCKLAVTNNKSIGAY